MAHPLSTLPPLLRGDPSVALVLGSRDARMAVAGPAQAFVIAGLAHISDRTPLFVITATQGDAERLVDDLNCYLGESNNDDGAASSFGLLDGPVVSLPAWETLPFERVSPDVSTMGHRLSLFWELFGNAAVSRSTQPRNQRPRVIVASIRSALQRLVRFEEACSPLLVRLRDELDATSLIQTLVSMGYRRALQVEHRGECAVRGGIVDVFAPTADQPVRIDLFGDIVDRLSVFDVSDQRSLYPITEAYLFACREMICDDAMKNRARTLLAQEPWGQWDRLCEGEIYDGMEPWFPWLDEEPRLMTDLLGKDAQVILVDPKRVRDRAVDLLDEENALTESLATTWGASPRKGDLGQEGFPTLSLPFDRLLEKTKASLLSMLTVADGPSTPTISLGSIDPVAGDAAKLARQVNALVEDGYGVTLCSPSAPGALRIADILAEEGVRVSIVDKAPSKKGAGVLVAPITNGCVIPAAKVAVLAESDITGRRTPHRRARARARPTIGFFDDLAPGSYVVHRSHGVALYSGVTTRTMGGVTRDYLVLQYRGDDKLYLPVDQIDVVTPYGGGETPTLSKMGGSDWARTRAKAKAAADDTAAELIQLYQARLSLSGRAFPSDTVFQREMEAAFPYSETPDQLQAIEDVKADMQAPRPMDRLVCGDVGFGKTEVAIRAIFKAAIDGTQAAILVPTTLLASQHAQTIADRFRGYPIRVELLSRFLSASDAKAVVKGLADGSVDVVIATHRLLGGDVVFKKLGLLVVDEEQRFGVSHKEAIKKLSQGIDVLTLTASPIPRTLEMALTGIRDLSMVNTPPAQRRPILTYVGEIDESAVGEAIRRELLREGQVFYVHNRVADIDAIARRLGSLVPEARIAVAHGQMDEGTLERTVLDFWEQRFDVLVCTTIIESGIDMPTVNTLVVDRADMLGLGQLHQLRGRVGRGGQRAYAYLFHPHDKVLSERAYERLRTIGEHTELGSGFKIAMRDLEIRGAGNLLGRDQSGHIAAVGYDLYVQMVSEAVGQARGEVQEEVRLVVLDVPGDAHLLASYMPAEDARLEAYRRLASAVGQGEVDDICAEWLDRFGPLPPSASGLIDLARLRVACLLAEIEEIKVVPARVAGGKKPVARIRPIKLKVSAQMRLRRIAPKSEYRESDHVLSVEIENAKGAAHQLKELICDLNPVQDDRAS